MAEGEKGKRKSPERTGPIVRRELTQVRDEVGTIRGLVREGSLNKDAIANRLDALYTELDRMDLRFKMHHDGEKKSK